MINITQKAKLRVISPEFFGGSVLHLEDDDTVAVIPHPALIGSFEAVVDFPTTNHLLVFLFPYGDFFL